MQTTLKQEPDDLKRILEKTARKAPIYRGEGNKIKLNPKNPTHKEWFNDDGTGELL